jgi:hypothetical protein
MMQAFTQEQLINIVNYAKGTLRLDFQNCIEENSEGCYFIIKFCEYNGLTDLVNEFKTDWEKYKSEAIEQFKQQVKDDAAQYDMTNPFLNKHENFKPE